MIKMPAIVIERPKLSRPMWNALKFHIARERQRKKQEQEADAAEVERQRREREDHEKQQEMTLEETKEQVAQSEARLAQLKEDKHQLFLQLKKVLNEDDTKRKIKESNFNSDMMLLHGYQPGAPHLGGVHPGSQQHGPTLYMQNLGPSRPVYKSGKEEPGVVNLQGGLPPPSVYGQSISLIPNLSHQAQTNQKRSRSPSPPSSAQLYHTYKPHSLSPYSSSKGAGNIYGGAPAVPGSIFYTHPVAVSASHSTASTGGYQLPPGVMYTYPPSHSSSSRSSYSIQAPAAVPARDEGPPAPKHHAGLYTPQQGAPQIPPRGYHHQAMEHMMNKIPSNYGPSEHEKYLLSTHSTPTSGSSGSGPPVSSRGLISGIPGGPGASQHPSGIPIQQATQHGKVGSITSGHPIQHSQRPPSSTVPYNTTTNPATLGQNPRLVYTQSGGQQPPHTLSRYYNNPP